MQKSRKYAIITFVLVLLYILIFWSVTWLNKNTPSGYIPSPPYSYIFYPIIYFLGFSIYIIPLGVIVSGFATLLNLKIITDRNYNKYAIASFAIVLLFILSAFVNSLAFEYLNSNHLYVKVEAGGNKGIYYDPSNDLNIAEKDNSTGRFVHTSGSVLGDTVITLNGIFIFLGLGGLPFLEVLTIILSIVALKQIRKTNERGKIISIISIIISSIGIILFIIALSNIGPTL